MKQNKFLNYDLEISLTILNEKYHFFRLAPHDGNRIFG
jgi:hypothetical protein